MRTNKAFTLIELLIVVAIIAILAAIAVPNFLEAQTRAKVSRVKSDLRSIATGIEAYRVDYNNFPEGTDAATRYPENISTYLGSLAAGYYTFATKSASGASAGTGFATLTTPIAYMTSLPLDSFAENKGGRLTYCYRNAKTAKNGYILTSFGPDNDALAAGGKGTTSNNPLGTFADTKTPSRLGDINEAAVCDYYEAKPATLTAVAPYGSLERALSDLSYDPTNGTVSDGDIYRVGP